MFDGCAVDINILFVYFIYLVDILSFFFLAGK